MALTVARLPDGAWASIAPEWQALDEQRPVRVPFTGPLWAERWWVHFRRDTLWARDDLALFTVRDTAGALVAVAPMMVTHRPGRSPLCTRELQFLGADTNVTEMRGMIAHPGTERAAAEALQASLATLGCADWVQWHGLPPDTDWPGLRSGGTVTDFVLPLATSWETMRAQLPRNIKQSLRKGHNSLARDGHTFQLGVLDGAAVTAGLERLLQLHALRAQMPGAVGHIDVFAQPQARAFIADYTRHAVNARLFTLNIAGRPVAMRLGFLYARELYLYYSGYDLDWSQYSVMTTLVGEAVRWAIGQGLDRVNLSTGADVSKTRWRPDAIETRSGYQVGAGIRAQLAFRLTDAVRRRRASLLGGAG